MPLRILWLSHLVPYPPKGGVLQRSFNLINELAKFSDIYLLAFIQKELINIFYEDYDFGLNDCKQHLSKICDTVKFIPIPQESMNNGMKLTALKSLFTIEPYTVNWLKSKQYMQCVNELLSSHQFDIIHADTVSLAHYTQQIKNIPLVMDHHNIESHMMIRRAEKEKNVFKKIYFYQEALKIRRYEKKACSQFDLNITCSELDSKRLEQLIPKIDVIDIPNGVDIAYFKHSNNPTIEPFSLIFAGRLNAYTNRKAILYFIDSIWPVLKSSIPKLKLYVVGSNPPKKIDAIDPDIIVTGYVDDVRPYIEKAEIYICPITDGGGTKLKVLDALAMAKPIVGNQEAFEGIDIKHGESAMIANSAEEYLDCIQQLFAKPQLKAKITYNAVKLIEQRYDYTAIGQYLHDTLSKIVREYSAAANY